MSKKKFDHLLEELEEQFHTMQSRMAKARDHYLARHEQDFAVARDKVSSLSDKLAKAKLRYGETLSAAKDSSSKKAQNQMKKAKAAVSLVASSLAEAKEIMVTSEDKLKSARPFDKKLAAREKALRAFEKEWQKKQKLEAEAKAKRAEARKKKAAPKAKPMTRSKASKAGGAAEAKAASGSKPPTKGKTAKPADVGTQPQASVKAKVARKAKVPKKTKNAAPVSEPLPEREANGPAGSVESPSGAGPGTSGPV